MRQIDLAGVEGVRWVPRAPTGVGALVLAGSSGRVDSPRAELLARHGVIAESIRWFAGPDQHDGPWEIPLELFLGRVADLARDCARVLVLGTSFGAEAALLTGCHSPHVNAVVAFAPSDVVWAGVRQDGTQTSHWSLDGVPLPYVPFDEDWQPVDDIPAYVGHYEASRILFPERVAEAAIPVEHIKHLVLVAGGDDQVWPAAAMCDAIMARRTRHGLTTVIVSEPAAGHRAILPGEPPVSEGDRMRRGGTENADRSLGAAAWAQIEMLLAASDVVEPPSLGSERDFAADDRRHAAGTPAAAAEAVTLQFHPNWPHRGGTVIESMARDRYYWSQFVTGTSNGGRTAHHGGDRWRWESRLFSGTYDEGPAIRRPVYGAWNRRADPYGGAIRFGSSYVRLRAEAVTRSSFCFPDSFLEPADVGEADLLSHLCQMADESGSDDLDDYVEAHVHGPVRFDSDVEALVLDPCFAGTQVEELAERLGCPIEFHPGFRAPPDCFDPEYRGAHIVDLARSLADELTPKILGDAARTGDHPAQSIKQVWHCLARFGRHYETNIVR